MIEGSRTVYYGRKLQYAVRVDGPSPVFARQLQQATGGVEREVRVAAQYPLRARGSRGPTERRDMRLETGAEELARAEMLKAAGPLSGESR